MNYEDELERSRARKSRRRESTVHERESRGSSADLWSATAEPGSRASRSRAASAGPGHSSHGSHGHNSHRRRKNSQKKKIIIGVLVGILALVAVILGAAYAYLDHHMDIANKSDFDKSDVTNLELSQETRDKMEEGFWTIAIFGVDSRDNSTGKGNQSDVIMIANIDRKTGEIKLVSVYRDTYLNINDRNVYNKINAAYAEGGPQQAIKAINKNLEGVGFRNINVEARPNLAVLRRTKMPAILVEVGFIDNAEDNKLFDTRLDEIAQAIADGIMDTLTSTENEASDGQPAAEKPVDRPLYRVQVGAFYNLQNAIDLEQELKRMGYNTWIVTA